MSQLGQLMALCLQEREERERGVRTIVELLRERMDDGGVSHFRCRKSLQEWLGLGYCGGPTRGTRPATVSLSGDDDDDEEFDGVGQSPLQEAQQEIEVSHVGQTSPKCIGHPSASATPSMNLAMALAAERQYREVQETILVNEPGSGPSLSLSPIRCNSEVVEQPGTPLRVSLLRLLEESDGLDEKEEKKADAGCDQMCYVCMGRKKGAAFIPCGHTFCRVCSRELWLNRGSCPLCNRSILEIFDIF